MSKKKKKVIVTSAPKASNQTTSIGNRTQELTFNKENFKWIGIGVGLITVGMLLMIGGYNENPNVWDESAIYGFRRTVLAPFTILAGLVVNIYALFK